MHAETLTTPAEWRDRLRARGLRVTSGRVATLCYVDTHPHSSAAEIHSALAPEHPTLSPQSVHNIVADLTDRDILRRIDLPATGSALYETQHSDNHHHVQCIACGRIEDVACVVGEAPCLTPDHDHGIRIIEAAVIFRGICRDCETSAPDAGAGAAADAGDAVAGSADASADRSRARG